MDLPTSPGTGTERSSGRWLAAVLLSVLSCLFIAAAFVVWVDPFQQYHLATRYQPRFYYLHHRYINPGLAKHQAYDTVVSGSSIMESTRNDFVAETCGSSGAINLSMPAMSASEQRLMLETAFAARPLRRVIAVLDFNEFSGGVDERQDVAGPLPRYLFDANPFNDLPYLLSEDVLMKAWRIVRGDTTERFTSDPNGAWFWGNIVQFGRDQVLRGLDLEHLNARYRQPQRTLGGMIASFDHNLMPLMRSHPETEFDLVWPPYSILVWLDFARRDQMRVSLDFKRYVFEATQTLGNVRIFDLQSDSGITHNLDRYYDIYHFEPAVNERMVEAACRNHDHVNAENLNAFERQLLSQVATIAKPEGLEALLGAPRAAKGKPGRYEPADQR